MIGETGSVHLGPNLGRLLRDPDQGVRLAAAGAARATPSPVLFPDLIRLLGAEATAAAASTALLAAGDAALPVLDQALAADTPPAADRPVRRLILHTMGQIGSHEASVRLLAAAARLDVDDRHAALLALSRVGGLALDDRRQRVPALIERELRECTLWFRCLGALGRSPGDTLLSEALALEIARARHRLFVLLGALLHREDIERARDNYLYGRAEQQAYALELLENLLPKPLWEAVAPLLENLPLDRRLAHLPARAAAGAAVAIPPLRALLADGVPPVPSGWWTRCCALHAAALLEAPPVEAVARHLSAEDPLVRHAAARACAALAEAAGSYVPDATRRRACEVLAECPSRTAVETVEVLRGAELFASTDKGVLAEIVPVLVERTLLPGEVLCREGDPGDELYIIADGRARVARGGRTLAEVGPGSVVGEFAVLLAAPRTAGITATTPVHLYRLGQASLGALMATQRSVAKYLIRLMLVRARANRAGARSG